MADDYYKRSYRAPPGARQHLQEMKEMQQNQIGRMEDSFEQEVQKRRNENRVPLLQQYQADPESNRAINVDQIKGKIGASWGGRGDKWKYRISCSRKNSGVE